MVHKDGVKGEIFFEEFCRQNNLEFSKVHQPFDFLVNGKFVEVKSARLFVKQYNNGEKAYGRYECWNKSQIAKLKKLNPWVCFVVTTENGCLIHGFTKAKNLPSSLRISLRETERLGLKSAKEFLRYIR